MSSRDAILDRVRAAIAPTTQDERRAAVAARLADPPCGVIPARGQLGPTDRLALFCDMAAASAATVERVQGPQGVPVAVGAYLRARNLAPEIRMGSDPALAGMEWDAVPSLQVLGGPSAGDDPACLSHAATAIAETGTLVLLSGPDNPTTLNFLPEHHIVVVEAAQVVGDMESALSLIRQRFQNGMPPRTINFVTGPSRSADIEQTLLLGAHGPRALHIIVVE